tara:strand:+ start:249 stop:809 length:561 start_codon:yes stop_codon:yes gene_type:complete
MKRTFDLVFSLILILLLFIPMLVISFIIRLESNGPSIYWSKRVGQYSKLFLMPKFRSMKINTPQLATHLMQDSNEFITPFGSFIRKNSIDELPQLYSIFKGDLSFVGPRPALFNQKDLIKLRKEHNLDKLKPGLTGWAQVNGRDRISIEKKVQFEIEYLNKKNFMFDLYIILVTIKLIFLRNNISH